MAAGTIDRAERNALLAEATDDVAAHVLRDNYEQNVLLGMARKLSPALVSVHQRFMQDLEAAGELNRALEFLPDDAELARREAEGIGLVSPENAVLVAYSKMTLTQHIADSTLPEEAWFKRILAGYFPPKISERFADDLPNHPLHREIITTVLVNDMINRSGTTFVHRAIEETGADIGQVSRAYSIVRAVFDLPSLWAAIEALDNEVPTSAQHAGYQEIRRLIDRATRWLVDVRFPITDVAAEIERYRPVVSQLGSRCPDLMRGAERHTLFEDAEKLVALGLPRELALRLAELLSAFLLLDVVEIADATGYAPAVVAELHYAISERLSIDELLTRVTALPRDDRWSTLARSAARHDVYAVLSAITTAVLRGTDDGLGPDQRIAAWVEQHAETGRAGPGDGARGPRPRGGRPRDAVGRAARPARAARLGRGAARDRNPRPHLLAALVAPHAPVGRERRDDGQTAAPGLVCRWSNAAAAGRCSRRAPGRRRRPPRPPRSRPGSCRKRAAAWLTALPTNSLATRTTSSMLSAVDAVAGQVVGDRVAHDCSARRVVPHRQRAHAHDSSRASHLSRSSRGLRGGNTPPQRASSSARTCAVPVGDDRVHAQAQDEFDVGRLVDGPDIDLMPMVVGLSRRRTGARAGRANPGRRSAHRWAADRCGAWV